MTAGGGGLRGELVRTSQLVWERGWVANHDGNLSVRLDGERLLATPTSFSKRLVEDADLIVLDRAGNVVEGRRRAFSEIVLHLLAYRVRDDVRAVLHAHPPTATGFAVAGQSVDPTITPEAVVSLGDRIPLVPHALPGDRALLETFGQALLVHDAVLFEGHGALTVGVDLEQALLRMELVEHLARIELVSRQVGNPRRLSRPEVETLLKKRTAAGLGPAARAKTAGQRDPEEDLATLIAAEVREALG